MLYFAYGSNMDPAVIGARCPSYVFAGRAVLRDHTLCFPRRSPVRCCGTAGLLPIAGEEVWGVLFALKAADEAALDAAEGCFPNDEVRESRHIREYIIVRRDGRAAPETRAWTYRAVPDDSNAAPSDAYMAHLIAGAEAHGLPERYLAKLRTIAAVPVI